MPLYDYKCSSCGKVTEIRHGFTERNEAPCPHCGGALARVFNPAPIVFKGSGFYVTDSRSKGGSSTSAPAAKTETKSESAPAAKSESTPATESKASGSGSAA